MYHPNLVCLFFNLHVLSFLWPVAAASLWLLSLGFKLYLYTCCICRITSGGLCKLMGVVNKWTCACVTADQQEKQYSVEFQKLESFTFTMILTLVWNDQQSFYLYHFHKINLSFVFVYVTFQSILLVATLYPTSNISRVSVR